MQTWDDKQLEALRPRYPNWDIWTVRSIYPRPSTTWCARPKGAPVATINASSPEELAEKIDATATPGGVSNGMDQKG
jgi:hypothetical protein